MAMASAAVAFTASRMPVAATRAARTPICRAAAGASLQHSRLTTGLAARQPTRQQRCTGLVVYASWGAPVEFAAGKVLTNEREAEQMQRLKVQIGGAASAYTTAGQYIQAKFGEEGKAGYFAIASAPGADKENGVVELLVKSQAGIAEQLCAAASGAELLVSAPQGKGFNVDSAPPADAPTLLIFATGSGISPIKALIESGALKAGERSDVRLYYGARSSAHMAYADSIPAWEAAGIKVIPVFSSEGHGYVQDAFAKEDGITDWAGVAAVLCGQKDMAIFLTDLLTSKGVPKERILSNF